MLAWGVCQIRFEDLVGPQGGGTIEQQHKAIEKISEYLNIPVSNRINSRLGEINDPFAQSFRIDQIDTWHSVVGAEIMERVKTYCPPLCYEAGDEI